LSLCSGICSPWRHSVQSLIASFTHGVRAKWKSDVRWRQRHNRYASPGIVERRKWLEQHPFDLAYAVVTAATNLLPRFREDFFVNRHWMVRFLTCLRSFERGFPTLAGSRDEHHEGHHSGQPDTIYRCAASRKKYGRPSQSHVEAQCMKRDSKTLCLEWGQPF